MVSVWGSGVRVFRAYGFGVWGSGFIGVRGYRGYRVQGLGFIWFWGWGL